MNVVRQKSVQMSLINRNVVGTSIRNNRKRLRWKKTRLWYKKTKIICDVEVKVYKQLLQFLIAQMIVL